MHRMILNDFLLGLLLCLLVGPIERAVGQEHPGADWAQAISPRVWAFPRDHGSHPEFRTEWWYFTGVLRAAAGDRYGYQLTFFRHGIRLKPARPNNPWSLRDIFLAHFALTDISAGRFLWDERISRSGPDLAGASQEGMNVWVLNWFAKMDGRLILLEARTANKALHLELTPRKPAVLHGRDGLSKKGPGDGQASYYTSFTDLNTRGRLRTLQGGPDVAVTGTSWFDHEFGSNQLTAEQVGWDWFSLHLSDGRDLMIYLLRLKDGSIEPLSAGTLVELDGSTRHLRLEEFRIEVLNRWQSPRSGGSYPSRWRIQVPSAEIALKVSPLLANQELHTEGSTRVIYWEGAVAGEGTSGGREITCEGYIELTGYAGSLGGLF